MKALQVKLTGFITLTLVALLGLANVSHAQTIRNDNPYLLLEQVADRTFSRVADERDQINQDLDYFRVIIREEMMPYVDSTYAAKRVLGRALKDTTEEQRQEFYAVFREYLVATYGRAFTQYDESIHRVEFDNANRFDPESRAVTVNTRVIEEGRPPIRMDFKMRFDKTDELWKAYDLVVEGVSLLNSKQSEIASVIRSRGIDGTIELLREKAQEPIKPLAEGEKVS
ncbi:MlaC/ttg2D family ABC transporter substrate-binding protein [Pseudidiomarina taiwanensis]|uniref:MlaC/ttg2D family ABC transporter substrate-binding protein n=1 Tax=Pseudidiomarina taiwanensis TaxID=337250 RepID=UPI001F543E45|nr:ABC transporter substrate-binding protein [Pseudidiomarina taiwanensis]